MFIMGDIKLVRIAMSHRGEKLGVDFWPVTVSHEFVQWNEHAQANSKADDPKSARAAHT